MKKLCLALFLLANLSIPFAIAASLSSYHIVVKDSDNHLINNDYKVASVLYMRGPYGTNEDNITQLFTLDYKVPGMSPAYAKVEYDNMNALSCANLDFENYDTRKKAILSLDSCTELLDTEYNSKTQVLKNLKKNLVPVIKKALNKNFSNLKSIRIIAFDKDIN